MNCVAFDLGGSSGKLILGRFDGNKLDLSPVHRFDNAPCPINGSLYWPIVGIYEQLLLGLKKAAALSGDNIASLGIDSFSNDFALIDRNSELLTPVRCYRDDRTSRYREATYAKCPPERIYELTGNQIAPFNTLMQLSAMREAQQGFLLEHAHRLLFVPDLLVHFLTGELVCEYTVSSVSQLYNYASDGWCDEILQTFDIPKRLFSPLVKPGTVVGSTRADCNALLGSNGFKVVSVCEHDTASAFLGCPMENCAIISSGTWALVGVEAEGPIINRFGYEHNIANEGGYSGRHRLLKNVMGSWLLQEVRTAYKEQGSDYSYGELVALAEKAAPFGAVIDVDDPVFFAPFNMPQKIRDKCLEQGGRAPESIGELTRCILESLAFKYRYCVETLEQLIDRPLPAIAMLGGGSKDALTCQFTANACGKVVNAGPDEATALGSLLVQLIGLGELSGMQEAKEVLRASVSTKKYHPMDTERWEEKYAAFKDRYHLQ